MVLSLFPTQIYQAPLASSAQLKRLTQELQQECYQIQKVDQAGLQWSAKNYRGGFTSYGSMDQMHKVSSTFEDLEKQIRRHVEKYIKILDMDISIKELFMSSCWVNIMPKGSTHTMHIHPLSVISGTFYVQTPPRCSNLKFEDPRLTQFMASPPRKARAHLNNQRFHEVSPKVGEVILFESWTKHEVPPNSSAKDRVSISFNYDWM